jgi:hypothetical protein
MYKRRAFETNFPVREIVLKQINPSLAQVITGGIRSCGH